MLSQAKIATQGRVAAQLVSQALGSTLILHRPADRCIGESLRANHQLGSRDRRIINFTFYSVLRWWGWLQHIAPQSFVSAWRNASKAGRDAKQPPESLPVETGKSWYPVMAAANLLEENNGTISEITRFWLQEAGISDASVPNEDRSDDSVSLAARARWMRPFFPKNSVPEFTSGMLMPEWALRHLSTSAFSSLDGKCPETENLLNWLQSRPPVWLRCQDNDREALRLRLQADAIPCTASILLPDALEIAPGTPFNVRAQADFQNGCYEVQDAAAQAVGYICAPKPGQQWWDACAGGGGKTLHLATLMNGKGSVLASDLRLYKLEELKLRARRAHFPNIRYKEWKGREMPRYEGRFDGVLIDAPCTCSGTWRRNPGARWITDETDIAPAAALQLQLLSNAAPCVKHGGVLVYSTCSMFEEENRGVVNQFLKTHPDFTPAPYDCPITKRLNDGTNQIWPWDSNCDAMFTARFIRR